MFLIDLLGFTQWLTWTGIWGNNHKAKLSSHPLGSCLGDEILFCAGQSLKCIRQLNDYKQKQVLGFILLSLLKVSYGRFLIYHEE